MAWPTVARGDPILATQFDALSDAVANWLGTVNANGNKLTNLNGITLTGVSADPGTPVAGQIWFRSDLHRLSYHDGATTRRIANVGEGGSGGGDGPLWVEVEGAKINAEAVPVDVESSLIANAYSFQVDGVTVASY